MIDVKNLSKRFGSTIAVRNISFQVPKGQVLGFLGPNAAGKSTTMRMLTCYVPADSGEVQIAGYNIDSDPLKIRGHIGYLPENAPLYMDMEVPDFFKFIMSIRKIPRSKQKAAMDKMIEVCGLKSVLHKKIGELSKGYRQRVGLAQAMIHDPDVLILDEPTSGLDPNQIVEIRELIKHIGMEKTVILSTHILQEVTATCDRILIINEGKLVADGSPSELTAQASGESTLWLSVNAPEDKALGVFNSVPGIINVSKQTEQKGLVRFALQFKSTFNPEEEIFRAVVDNDWVLTEMHRETVSLENVFAKLTT